MSKKKQLDAEPEKMIFVQSRLLGIEELMKYTNLGKNNARQLGEESRAIIRIGRRVLYDRQKIDNYITELSSD